MKTKPFTLDSLGLKPTDIPNKEQRERIVILLSRHLGIYFALWTFSEALPYNLTVDEFLGLCECWLTTYDTIKGKNTQ